MKIIQQKRILLDPLGGLYWDDRINEWRYQKRSIDGHPADISTSDIAASTYDALRIVGVDVISTRCLRRSHTEIGQSRAPLYHEGAGQYLRNCRVRPSLREDRDNERLPEKIWNDGATSLERDIRTRLNFARYVKADLMVVIDVTSCAIDQGPEVRHNGVGDVQEVAELTMSEVSKRVRRRPHLVRPLFDEEAAYASLRFPVMIINCGSAFDPQTSRLLRKSWYKGLLSLGIFAGIWKNLAQDQTAPEAETAGK